MINSRVIGGAVLSSICCASIAAADILHFDGFGAGSFPHPRLTSRGGEFRVTTDTLGAFITFCVEITERAVIGETYNFTPDTGSRKGSDPSGFDPLSFESAWLYLHYRDGTLDDLVDSFNYGSNASANALQEAFWVIEDEPLNGFTSGAAQDLIDAAAIGSFGWSHLHGVRVMVLTDDKGRNYQDQLAVIPAPGAAFVGIVGLAALRRLRRIA